MPQRRAALVVLLTLVLYTVGFLGLFPLVGESAAALSMLPVALLGWLLGWQAGGLAALLSVPLNIGLFRLVGAPGAAIILQNLAGVVVAAGIGLGAGAARRMLVHMRAQAEALTRERAALQAEVAERQRISQELARATAVAEAASRAKSSFLAHMSHELRTPLTAILGYADLLQLDLRAGDHSHLEAGLASIRHAGAHLLALINGLLDLAQIEAGRLSLAARPCAIGALMQAVVSTAGPQLEACGSRIELLCPPELGSFEVDPTRLQQLLLNLLSAAASWAEHALVTLVVRSGAQGQAELLCFEIRDSGQGIGQQELHALVEAAAEGEGWLDSPRVEAGLSLAISKRLCRLMGGELTVPLDAPAGTRFIVRLPVRPAEAALPGR